MTELLGLFFSPMGYGSRVAYVQKVHFRGFHGSRIINCFNRFPKSCIIYERLQLNFLEQICIKNFSFSQQIQDVCKARQKVR